MQVSGEHNFNQISAFDWGGGQMSVTGGGGAICSTAGEIAPPVNMLDEALFWSIRSSFLAIATSRFCVSVHIFGCGGCVQWK